MLRRLLTALAIAVPLGCSEGGAGSPDLSLRAMDLSIKGSDLAQAGASCSVPADCRLYSNDCDGCSCQALRSDEVDPVCNGTPVSCFVDPCAGKSADCQNAHCVVK
jgi:hypothetical protein